MKTRLHIAHKAMTLLTLLLVSSMVKASDIAPGYYYMKGTEASTANGYYLRATSSDLPRMITHQMPETPALDEKPFIWKVESMDGGFYSIQSIYDHRYLGGQVGSYAHHGSMSDSPHAIKFTFFETYNGVNNAWKLDAQTDRDTFYGTAMRPGQGGEALFLWYCDSQGGEVPAWYFEPVDASTAATLEETFFTYNGDEIEDGYYMLRADEGNVIKPGAYLYADPGDVFRTYLYQASEEISTTEITDETLKFIYYVKKTTEGYTFQNQQNGRFIGGSPNGFGHHVGAVTAPAPMVLKYYAEKEAYSIEDKQQPANDWLPAYLNSGYDSWGWWVGKDFVTDIFWDLIKLDASAVEAVAQRNLYVVGSLQNASWDTESMLYTLDAQENGIYSGTITVEDDGDGIGFFTLYSATMNGGNKIQYSSPSAGVQLFPGLVSNFSIGSGYNWIVAPGTYLVTVDMNNNTIRVNDPSQPDVIFSKAYAELKATIEATLEQWPGLDLSSVEAVLNNPDSSDDELTAARNSIPDLINAFVKKQMADASETRPIDATVLIKNANCANDQGWMSQNAVFTDNMIYAANSGFNVYQTLTDLPNGVYEVGVNAVSRYGAPKAYYQEAEALGIDKHNAYLYATSCGTSLATPVADIFDFQYSELGVSGENDYSGAGWFVPTNTGAAKAYFQEGRYGESHLFVYVNDGTLTIGARRAESATDDMFVADDWTLKYYGNSPSAFNLIATDLMETRPDVESTPAQATIVSAYQDALDAVNELDDESKMAETYTSLAAANDALTGSQIAYAIFQNKVKEVEATMAENPNLEGVGASLLRSYLTETEEPGTFENGTANYILKNGNLDAEALVAEMAQMDVMLENALRGGVAPGTDITALFRNMNFDEADFAGWTESHTGNGSCSGSHGLNTNLVAGWWNMDSIELLQTGTDLPNGIYAIYLNAFYRPGSPANCSTENEMSAYVVVNGLKTPMLNILSDALSETEAEENVNCHSSDYSTGEFRYPNAPNGASVAFAADRYRQVAYGVVTDGVLSFGVCQDAYPAYDDDWMMIDNFKVVFMGDTDEATNAMVEAQSSRAEEMLASIFTYRESTREGLIEALDMPANDFESKYKKAERINQLCNEAIVTGALSAIMEEVLSDFHTTSQGAFQSGRITEDEFNAYDSDFRTVWGKLFSGLYSDEEIIEITQQYRDLTESLIPSVPSGYYYMKGSAVSSNPDTYLSASSSDLPFMVFHSMPEVPTMDEQAFIWKVESMGNGTASIQSIYDHRYLGGQVGTHYHHGTMSSVPHAITFTYFSSADNAGQSEAWKLDAALDHDSYYGTAMRPGMGGETVFLWYCDGQQGEVPAWVFEPVDEEVAKTLEETVPEYTGDDIEEGYYYVRAAATNTSNPGIYLYYNVGDLHRTYQKAVDGELSTTEVSEDMYPYVYHVTKEPRGYAFQNIKSGRYIGGTPNSNGHHVGSVTVAAPMKLEFDEEKQAYTILDESQFNNGFLPAYLNSGSEAFAWWAGSDEGFRASTYWNLIRITDPTLVGIQETQADTQGNMPEGLYTLDGRKIGTGNVRPGIYIKANGSSVKKILIK